MITTEIRTDPMIAFTLPSVPASVGVARVHVRAALDHQGLGDYAEDAEIIASELVANAVQHVHTANEESISLILMRVWSPSAIAIVVKDASPEPPVMADLALDSERGRGLRIVDALSASWSWHREGGGKAVTAILATTEHAS